MGFSVDAQYRVTFTGLTPGQQIQMSIGYSPDDGTPGRDLDGATQRVNGAGVASYPFDADEIVGKDISGKPLHTPGKAHVWAHVPGPFDSPPLETSDGEASGDFVVN